MLTVEDLVDLGRELRRDKFSLASHQYLAARQVLLHLSICDAPLRLDLERVGSFLAPIFCTSAAEQRRFPAVYRRWLERRYPAAIAASTPQPTARVAPEVRRFGKGRWRWQVFIALFAILFALIVGWAAWQHWRERELTGVVTVLGDFFEQESTAHQAPPLEGAVITLGAATAVTDANGRYSLPVRASSFPALATATLDGYEPSTLAIGTDFAAQRELLYLRTGLEPLAQANFALLPTPPEPTTTKISIEEPPVAQAPAIRIGAPRTFDLKAIVPPLRWWKLIIWRDAALAAAPVFAFLAWQGWRRRRRPVLQRLTSSTPPQLSNVHLQNGAATFAESLPLRRLAQALRRRRLVESDDLRVEPTIAATVMKGGVFTPIRGANREPDYIVLVDTACQSDHQARLAQELINDLTRSDVQIERWTFDKNPALCRKLSLQGLPFTPARASNAAQRLRAQAIVSLEELHAQHPDHRLLIFSDGAGLFNAFDGSSIDAVETLMKWTQPTLLTPKPLVQWGEREWSLDRLGCTVLPVTRDGLLVLMGVFAGAPERKFTGPTAHRPPERSYELGARRFVQRDAPSASEVARLLADLRSDLGRRGFAWLAACAAYPEVHWGVTLRLGVALLPDRSEMESALPRLARLIWFREAFMPDWLREALLDELSPEDEAQTRALLQTMLASVSSAAGGEIPLRIALAPPPATGRFAAVTRAIREQWRRWQVWRRSEAIVRAATPDSPLRDYVFLRFLSGSKLGRLSLAAPASLLQLLFRGGSPLLGFRPTLVFALACIASIFIAVATNPIRTGQYHTVATHARFSANDATLIVPFVSGVDSEEAGDSLLALTGTVTFDLRESAVRTRLLKEAGAPLEISSDGRWLAVANSDDDTIAVWDLDRMARVGSFPAQCSEPIFRRCATFSADGRYLAYASTAGDSVVLWDVANGRIARTLQEPAVTTPEALAFSGNGRSLAVLQRDALVMWDLSSGTPSRILNDGSDGTIDLSRSGRWLALSEGSDVGVIDLSSSQPVPARVSISETGVPLGLTISPDERLLAFSEAHEEDQSSGLPIRGSVQLVDLTRGAPLNEWFASDERAYVSTAFSNDSRTLAAVGFDGAVSIWSIPEGFPSTVTQRSYALFILGQAGVRDLGVAKLADDMAVLLRERFEFGVTVLAAASAGDVSDALDALATRLRPEDQLLIYILGGGARTGDGYGTDAAGSVSLEKLEKLHARQLLIIDATIAESPLMSRPADEASADISKARDVISGTSSELPRGLIRVLRESTTLPTAADIAARLAGVVAYDHVVGRPNDAVFRFPQPKLTDGSNAPPVDVPTAQRAEQLKLSTSGLSFPLQRIATQSTPQVVRVTNDSDRAWNLRSQLDESETGTFLASGCKRVAARSACEISVIYSPDAPGVQTGRLMLIASSDAAGKADAFAGSSRSDLALSLTGSADWFFRITGEGESQRMGSRDAQAQDRGDQLAPTETALRVEFTSKSMAAPEGKIRRVQLTNTLQRAVRIGSSRSEGSATLQAFKVDDGCTGQTVGSNDGCDIIVHYVADSARPLNAKLQMTFFGEVLRDSAGSGGGASSRALLTVVSASSPPPDASACLSGSWGEITQPPSDTFTWSFSLDSSGVLHIVRNDKFAIGSFAWSGTEWSGTLRWGDGQQWPNVTLSPNTDCTEIDTNQRWGFRRR
ncbi:WD40 repeat protein [Povalibacter uvarum]|uniref:WD40 repeat protein n=1 Tax=Povalibacter uvarum TaxID=732238 RepID=A0A841HG52_9GAMM|nr:beta-propeller fold lactonase family protein [Povalibacter uvarum]MBB6091330.1 WD40 repeat protein [Povalibacter uvarum]